MIERRYNHGVYRFGVRTCFVGDGECSESENLIDIGTGTRDPDGVELFDTVCAEHKKELDHLDAFLNKSPENVSKLRCLVNEALKKNAS